MTGTPTPPQSDTVIDRALQKQYHMRTLPDMWSQSHMATYHIPHGPTLHRTLPYVATPATWCTVTPANSLTTSHDMCSLHPAFDPMAWRPVPQPRLEGLWGCWVQFSMFDRYQSPAQMGMGRKGSKTPSSSSKGWVKPGQGGLQTVHVWVIWAQIWTKGVPWWPYVVSAPIGRGRGWPSGLL